jgi:hypothetical protein
MTATDIHGSQVKPSSSFEPQPFTSGASAMSGTVWLSTTSGSTAERATRNRVISSASRKPTTTPITQETAAIRRLVAPARSTASHSGSAPGCAVSGSPRRAIISDTCGMARSLVRGSTSRSPTDHPCSGTTALTSSHRAASRTRAARPSATGRSARTARGSGARTHRGRAGAPTAASAVPAVMPSPRRARPSPG